MLFFCRTFMLSYQPLILVAQGFPLSYKMADTFPIRSQNHFFQPTLPYS